MEHASHSEEDTAVIARTIAAKLAPGSCLCLQGDLGAGKSVFCRALIRSLAGEQDLEVPSPTFTLLQTYDTPCGIVYHFDLYRLDNPVDVFELGWDEALATGITLVEWPEKAGPYLPANARRLTIKQTGPLDRLIQESDYLR
ncbi:MAG: tRNA (adenosine(37)-N6)-threonylcarbamoyltransferase complex ATPase subunit type 1 TsaE [Alphaproteobacteria bacterium]|nr:tRNA (adenosine(37)-N6)-threonylcarbamoyltransferase complex ATPase subunit type 1 TsaE [Alphaproteobacteria bacterium]